MSSSNGRDLLCNLSLSWFLKLVSNLQGPKSRILLKFFVALSISNVLVLVHILFNHFRGEGGRVIQNWTKDDYIICACSLNMNEWICIFNYPWEKIYICLSWWHQLQLKPHFQLIQPPNQPPATHPPEPTSRVFQDYFKTRWIFQDYNPIFM